MESLEKEIVERINAIIKPYNLNLYVVNVGGPIILIEKNNNDNVLYHWHNMDDMINLNHKPYYFSIFEVFDPNKAPGLLLKNLSSISQEELLIKLDLAGI